MSYTPPPPGFNAPVQSAGQNPRPATVTLSSILLYVVGALTILSGAVAIYVTTAVPKDVWVEAMSTGSTDTAAAEAAANFVVIVAWVTGILYLVIAAVLVLCGVFASQGKQWARITAWVFSGLLLCCGIVGVASQASGLANSGANQEEMTELLAEYQPAWATTFSTVAVVVQILAVLAIIVLLALPPSNAFFRKPAPEWTPPTYPSV